MPGYRGTLNEINKVSSTRQTKHRHRFKHEQNSDYLLQIPFTGKQITFTIQIPGFNPVPLKNKYVERTIPGQYVFRYV